MDDPAETCWSWSHWKFGLKRDDLFTKLHDRFNTIPSSILDPEAFHHDVCEISNVAETADEFYRRLEDRKNLRLRELNESLESAAFEIIGNPCLIGTEQWKYAVQLFRTKSLDSLVRYFASYLPHDHPWYEGASATSASDTGSIGSLEEEEEEGSQGSFFPDDHEDGPIMMDEPLEFSSSLPACILSPSPRFMTMCSDSSVASPADSHDDFDSLAPSRTLSFSESEPDCCSLPDAEHTHHHHADKTNTHSYQKNTSQSTNDAAIAVVVEYTSTASEDAAGKDGEEQEDGAATARQQSALVDLTEELSETPTPKPERHQPTTSSFFETKPSLPHRRHRSLSPSRPHPLSECEANDMVAAAYQEPEGRSRLCGGPLSRALIRSRRDNSPAQRNRRSLRERLAGSSRVHKPSPLSARTRGRARGAADEF